MKHLENQNKRGRNLDQRSNLLRIGNGTMRANDLLKGNDGQSERGEGLRPSVSFRES